MTDVINDLKLGFSKTNIRGQAKEKPTVLAFDSCAICHAAKHVTKKWMKKGVNTGVIYGFFSKILVLIEKFEPDTIVFTWDSLYNKRRDIYSGYKLRYSDDLPQKEQDENEIAFAQFNQLRDEILCDLGFKNVFSKDGYEADDIMATLAMDKGYNLILVTPDHDMFQSLSSTCTIFDPRHNVVVTKKKFCDRFGIEPAEWGLVKAIAGCGSDTVDGIKGVGEKTAIRYVCGKLDETTKAYKAIEAGMDTIITRNAELVILPLDGAGEFSVSHGIKIWMRSFIKMCEKFDFKFFLSPKYFKRWKKALRMI